MLDQLTPDRIAMGLTYYVVLLFSLSVHESAHAWMALKMGDTTAASLGRITLNPIAHIDPLGTVVMPLLAFFSNSLPLLAWAKPTPVQARNFKHGHLARGHILVAGAGPASNMLLACLFAFALFVAVRAGVSANEYQPLLALIRSGVLINVFLAVFNLVPLPPLDGSWIASWALPREIASRYDAIVEPYGQWILLILFATGLLGMLISPISNAILQVLGWLVYR